jgi:hypothetical protein
MWFHSPTQHPAEKVQLNLRHDSSVVPCILPGGPYPALNPRVKHGNRKPHLVKSVEKEIVLSMCVNASEDPVQTDECGDAVHSTAVRDADKGSHVDLGSQRLQGPT